MQNENKYILGKRNIWNFEGSKHFITLGKLFTLAGPQSVWARVCKKKNDLGERGNGLIIGDFV